MLFFGAILWEALIVYSRFAGMLCLVVFLVSGLRATGFEEPIIENGSAETVVADNAADGVANIHKAAETTGTQPVAKQRWLRSKPFKTIPFGDEGWLDIGGS